MTRLVTYSAIRRLAKRSPPQVRSSSGGQPQARLVVGDAGAQLDEIDAREVPVERFGDLVVA